MMKTRVRNCNPSKETNRQDQPQGQWIPKERHERSLQHTEELLHLLQQETKQNLIENPERETCFSGRKGKRKREETEKGKPCEEGKVTVDKS